MSKQASHVSVKLAGTIAGLALASGCAIGPNFKTPPAPVPNGWTEARPVNQTAPAIDLSRWWIVLKDPQLNALVDRALLDNPGLQQAATRLRQARASRSVTVSGFWPSADVGASATRSGTANAVGNFYRTGLDAAWELDIFGGTRRDIEAATADLQAAREDERAVRISLAAEVVLSYIDLRSSQQRLIVAQNNLDAQRQTAELTRRRQQGGFASALDVVNAEAQATTTAAQIPTLEAGISQSIHSLSVLLGQPPSTLNSELVLAKAIPTAPPAVPAGVPADLLRNRPDIRKAEAKVHAATARIGAATAELLPKLTLSGTVGYQSNQSASLLDWSNRNWSFGPSASWRIFDAGRVISQVELQKAMRDESVIAYRLAVLIAMQEVEDALVASAKEKEHRVALNDTVTLNRRAVELSTKLYAQGQVDFLNVLNAQRGLLSAEDALAQSDRNLAADIVALCKALGGGWKEEDRPVNMDSGKEKMKSETGAEAKRVMR
jgi:NodT family efflux transporter outer membrane factor (OMF) lipoprotein